MQAAKPRKTCKEINLSRRGCPQISGTFAGLDLAVMVWDCQDFIHRATE